VLEEIARGQGRLLREELEAYVSCGCVQDT
jgi:hypothetical protein